MFDIEHEPSVDQKHGGIQVIARAAAIMRTLGANPQGLSLGAIAQQVNLPRSTVQRIVNALEAEGLAASGSGGWRLGPELGRLIHQSQVDIISAVRPLLEELSSELQESVVLCSLERDQVVVINRIVAERELRVVFPVGVIRLPLHATAPGKALLAAMSDEQVQQLLPESLTSRTKKTRDRATLLAELDEIRKSSIATDVDEFVEGIAGFAVAVKTYFGCFSIAAVLPTSRASHTPELQQALLKCKASIEKRIGNPVA